MARAEVGGYTAAELLVTVAVAALVSATTLPVVAGALGYERADAGARYLTLRLRALQPEALRRGRFAALHSAPGETDTLVRPYLDGDGDGVLLRDIQMGIDPPLGPAEQLGARAAGVTLRVNQPVTEIDGTGWLATGSDPLRIGRTSLVSFSPLGSATAGTLYVAGVRGPQLAVRLTGATGRIRLLRFDPGASAWRP